MFTKTPYLSEHLTSSLTQKSGREKSWRLYLNTPFIQVLIGLVMAIIALPFGLTAAALAPVAIGFAKVIIDRYVGDNADPTDFVWMIVGGAIGISFIKLIGLA